MPQHPPFNPARWLPGPHLQTLWPVLRRRPRLEAEWERVELPDGDFLDLVWVGRHRHRPVVMLLHGLEGNFHSHYAGGMLAALEQAGWSPVLMHFRGCSGEPNRLPRSYHSGETGDPAFIAGLIRRRSGRAPVAAVGFSLGGNVLLKWLGEAPERCPLQAAVAVSVPFLLDDAAKRMEQGLSRIYQAYLLGSLRRAYRSKFSRIPSPLDLDIDQIRSLRQFDDRVTAPLHGFKDAADYYRRCSCRQFLGSIHIPTLILHARDDPFMRPETIPDADELAASVTLEASPHGGHVGFVAGRWPWRARYWLEQRVPAYLQQVLE